MIVALGFILVGLIFIALGLLEDARLWEQISHRQDKRAAEIAITGEADCQLEIMAIKERWHSNRLDWLEATNYDPRVVTYYNILDELTRAIQQEPTEPGQIERLWLQLRTLEKDHEDQRS